MSPGSVCWKGALQGQRTQVHHTHPGQLLAPSPLTGDNARGFGSTGGKHRFGASVARLFAEVNEQGLSAELGSFVLNYTAQLLFTL